MSQTLGRQARPLTSVGYIVMPYALDCRRGSAAERLGRNGSLQGLWRIPSVACPPLDPRQVLCHIVHLHLPDGMNARTGA
ncbi:hypothetical protein DCS_07765 [Drechmeria coniospora]|uniref:Uncharacterized protein n=1 Tax=Drechmeria coniospora TaxID=98403 RepID=A0A151GFH4_DRECN|nr:hypothetical protein DCS_07765 [Drechmeria coniospora]KYK55801.1 hypothetical protein DCS_07765 [Drechmeria coniospora]